MKQTTILLGFVLTICAAAAAQVATGDRVVVPARNSGRPRLVKISMLNGGITVKAYSGNEVIVEANSSEGRRHPERETHDGLRRLEMPGNLALEVTEEDNVINVRTQPNADGQITVTVPVNTSLKLKCTNGGDIKVDGVNGEIDADNLNGRVTLNNVSGTAIAHSLNGSVTVSMNRVDPAKPLSFSTLNGDIDVTLPPDVRLNVKLKADNGDIYSDFDIKLDLSGRKPVTENNTTSDGRFRVKIDRAVLGTINGGGAEASFNTFNGRISIRKKK